MMKHYPSTHFRGIPAGRKKSGASGAFTLPEIMISMALFVLLMGGIVVVNLYGLRWFQIVQVKMLASDSARKAIGHMTDEIRTCSSVYVGNVNTNAVFTSCTNGQSQQGSSLLIYQTTNTTNYILYFFNSPDLTFRRVNSAVAGDTTILATTVTNSATIFQMQDYLGNVLTNSQNNSLIHCSLQFYSSGTTNPVSDFYKLETCATPRLLQ